MKYCAEGLSKQLLCLDYIYAMIASLISISMQPFEKQCTLHIKQCLSNSIVRRSVFILAYSFFWWVAGTIMTLHSCHAISCSLAPSSICASCTVLLWIKWLLYVLQVMISWLIMSGLCSMIILSWVCRTDRMFHQYNPSQLVFKMVTVIQFTTVHQKRIKKIEHFPTPQINIIFKYYIIQLLNFITLEEILISPMHMFNVKNVSLQISNPQISKIRNIYVK